jgi:hypothetical protein
MVYKKHLLLKSIVICFFICSIVKNINANIIYSKGDLLITEIELDKFINLYIEKKNIKLTKPIAIKKLILQKKIIRKLLNDQNNYIEELDKNIKLEFGKNIFKDKSLIDFIRYSKIRDEFTLNYFNNNFSRKDLKLALNNFTNLTLPLSMNGCMTIVNTMELSKNESFIENLFLKLKENISEIIITVDNQKYTVCPSQVDFKKIEKKIIELLEHKTEIEFKNFIYAK